MVRKERVRECVYAAKEMQLKSVSVEGDCRGWLYLSAAKHIPQHNNRFRPYRSMNNIEMTLPGKFAAAKMKESAYGFTSPEGSSHRGNNRGNNRGTRCVDIEGGRRSNRG